MPEDSLLAEFGGPDDYRDCFIRDVPGAVSLPEYIERFYCSMAFLPERMVLGVIAGRSSRAAARAFARGEAERFGAWKVVERRDRQALFESRGTGTAIWFSVEPLDGGTLMSSSSGVEDGPQGQPVGQKTRLYLGSWVGNVGQSGWKAMLQPHVWYSRFLLGAV